MKGGITVYLTEAENHGATTSQFFREGKSRILEFFIQPYFEVIFLTLARHAQ